MNVRAVGDRALLVEVGDNAAVHGLAAAVRDRFGRSLEDVVPGHETLLVCWPAGSLDAAEVERALAQLTPARPTAPEVEAPEVRIAVRYDGPDLEEVAMLAGISSGELIEIHAGGVYTAAFIGFAPGFAYLIGGDERLSVPRRESPRLRVAAGSVAVAGGYSAVYPSEGPGGWQLIGRTETVLFDLEKDPPALITPGTRVRFEPV